MRLDNNTEFPQFPKLNSNLGVQALPTFKSVGLKCAFVLGEERLRPKPRLGYCEDASCPRRESDFHRQVDSCYWKLVCFVPGMPCVGWGSQAGDRVSESWCSVDLEGDPRLTVGASLGVADL